MHDILVIDDDESIRGMLEMSFREEGFSVTAVADGQAGLDLLKQKSFDLIFLDLFMPVKDGMEVLKELAEMEIKTPAIMMTAHASVRTAVDAIRLGAFDYVTKPFMADELLILGRRALSMTKLTRENVMLKRQLKRHHEFHRLIGTSLHMQQVFDTIDTIADTDSPVLISGEDGTGKEIIAKTIHYNSPRSQHAFVPVNCRVIPKELLESDLFGHEKGAFKGAVRARVGRIELAGGGTIFFDEIGDTLPSLQAKLLRVIQRREFEKAGGTGPVKVDVRILAATSKDLGQAVKLGLFREDLFSALNVVPLHLAPLRERPDDIPLLLEHFMRIVARKKKRDLPEISQHALEALLQYKWPGNLHELENLADYLVTLARSGSVGFDDLPERFRDSMPVGKNVEACADDRHIPAAVAIMLGDEGVDLNAFVEGIERNLINQALQRSGGVKKKAAELLGINRTTLLAKLKKIGMEVEQQGGSSGEDG